MDFSFLIFHIQTSLGRRIYNLNAYVYVINGFFSHPSLVISIIPCTV